MKKNLLNLLLILLFIELNAQWTNVKIPYTYGNSTSEVLFSDSSYIIIKNDNEQPLVSSDGALTWVKPTSGYSGQSKCAILFNNVLFSGSNSGCFSSTDKGKTWKKSGTFSSCKSLIICRGTLYAGTNDGIKKLNTTNGTWEHVSLKGEDVAYIHYNRYSNKMYIFGFFNEKISLDLGVTVKDFNSPSFFDFVSSQFAHDTSIFCSSGGVYISYDNGENFARLDNAPGNSPSSVFKNGNDLYVSFQQFQAPAAEGIYKYNLINNTWESFNTGLTNTNIQYAFHNGIDKYYAIHKGGDFVVKLFSVNLKRIVTNTFIHTNYGSNLQLYQISNGNIQLDNTYDKVTVTNILGQVLYEFKNINQIELSDLSSEIYFVEAMKDTRRFSNKFYYFKI